MNLDDLCTHIVDCEHKTAPLDESGDYFAVGTPAMRGNSINYGEARRINRETYESWTRRLDPKHGDLLLAREAPVGPVVRIPPQENVAPGQRTVLLRPNPSVVDSLFLYYYLISPARQSDLLINASGSTIPHLNVVDVRSFPTPDIPSLPEQRAIAEVLGALDDKIAANDRVMNLSSDLVFQAYRRALSCGDTTVAPLSEVCEVDFGEAFKGENFTSPGEGRPLIRIRDLKTFTPQTWTTEVRANETVLSPGDVVVGMDAEFRATWWLGQPGLLNQRVCRIRGISSGPAFVAEALRSPLAEIENEKSGTTVIHLNKSDLERAAIQVPNPEPLAQFEELCEPLVKMRVAAYSENQKLASTRESLLPLLMSGKVRVRDAEKVVEEVV